MRQYLKHPFWQAVGLLVLAYVVIVFVIPMLPGRFDFAFIDAEKEDYLEYLRQLEPKLVKEAVVIADNTGPSFRRDVKPYLDYVRDPAGRYTSRAYEVGDDAIEVSLLTR